MRLDTGAQALLEEVAGYAEQRDIAVKGDGCEQNFHLICTQTPEKIRCKPVAVAAALLAALQQPLLGQVAEVAVQRAVADVLNPLRERPVRRDELILQERLLVEKVTAIISSTQVPAEALASVIPAVSARRSSLPERTALPEKTCSRHRSAKADELFSDLMAYVRARSLNAL